MTIINNLKRLTPSLTLTASLLVALFERMLNLPEGKLHNKKKTQKSRKMYIIVCSKNNICLSECIFYKNKTNRNIIG